MPYFSIKEKLKYNNEARVKELFYQSEYINDNENNDFKDIFNGNIYKALLKRNLFNNKRNITFIIFCDKYQIFK